MLEYACTTATKSLIGKEGRGLEALSCSLLSNPIQFGLHALVTASDCDWPILMD